MGAASTLRRCTYSLRVVGGPSGGMTVNLKSMPVCGVQSTVSVRPVQAHTTGHWASAGEGSKERDRAAARRPNDFISRSCGSVVFVWASTSSCLGEGLDGNSKISYPIIKIQSSTLA